MVLAEVAPCAALEREVRERPARLLAELERREPEVDVLREALTARLIEHRPAAVPIGQLAEPPDELLRARSGADGIAERDPASPRDLIHHERTRVVAEQETLVAHQRRIGQRVVREPDRGARRLQLLAARGYGLGP